MKQIEKTNVSFNSKFQGGARFHSSQQTVQVRSDACFHCPQQPFLQQSRHQAVVLRFCSPRSFLVFLLYRGIVSRHVDQGMGKQNTTRAEKKSRISSCYRGLGSDRRHRSKQETEKHLRTPHQKSQRNGFLRRNTHGGRLLTSSHPRGS